MLGHWGVDVGLPLLVCVSRQEGEEKRKKKKRRRGGEKRKEEKGDFPNLEFFEKKNKR
jgi:hypothetical protein